MTEALIAGGIALLIAASGGAYKLGMRRNGPLVLNGGNRKPVTEEMCNLRRQLDAKDLLALTVKLDEIRGRIDSTLEAVNSSAAAAAAAATAAAAIAHGASREGRK